VEHSVAVNKTVSRVDDNISGKGYHRAYGAVSRVDVRGTQ
jgi:hypothetical protein